MTEIFPFNSYREKRKMRKLAAEPQRAALEGVDDEIKAARNSSFVRGVIVVRRGVITFSSPILPRNDAHHAAYDQQRGGC